MKYCPICERNYGDEVQVCQMDGATLKILGSRQDRYLGNVIKGRYKVLKKLGEGGMGTVYLAEQMSVGRKVALKLLQGNYATDDEFIGRFRREARLAASLNHRNIVTVYDFDQSDDETLFIAMEYLDGAKLSDLIRRDGPLSIGRAARLGLQVAEGLDAAHRAGVIHRDIKPDNIMVVGEEIVETVKLMDFGIARLRDPGAGSRLTRADVIMGTPAYMAPEQAEGAEVSEQTDIYALGIVLYEMLSGSVPFKASTPGAVLVKQIQEAPVPLRKLRREIPASIERVVMQALEKKPQKRQRDMREVVQGLQKVDVSLVNERAAKTVVETVILPKGSTDKLQSLKKPFFWVGAAVGAFIGIAVLGSLLWVAKKDRRTSVPEVVAEKAPAHVPAPNLLSLSLSGDRQEIAANETLNVTLKGQYSDGTQKNLDQGVEWLSSEPRVATIDDQGQVTARQTGETKITARYGDLVSPAWTLAVRAEQPAVAVTVPPEKPAVKPLVVTKLVALAIFTDRREVQTQERLSLRVKARYSDGNEKGLSSGVEWRSSDTAVAFVDSRGELLALRPGRITVVARWGGIESSAVNILVRESPAKPPPEPPTYKPPVEPPQVMPAKPLVQAVNITSYINRAKSYRVQGNYAAALAELEKARTISPGSQEVFDEIEATRRACNAEQRLGREGLTC